MSTGQITPGPWYIAPKARGKIYVRTAGEKFEGAREGKAVCIVVAGAVGDAQTIANARLIAAAPDLLAALVEAERCMGIIQSNSHHIPASLDGVLHNGMHAARAAIAKAEGRS